LLIEHHWPWHIDSAAIAKILVAFIEGSPLEDGESTVRRGRRTASPEA